MKRETNKCSMGPNVTHCAGLLVKMKVPPILGTNTASFTLWFPTKTTTLAYLKRYSGDQTFKAAS